MRIPLIDPEISLLIVSDISPVDMALKRYTDSALQIG
jgi:hypothetical protein